MDDANIILTGEIVASYLASHSLPPTEVPGLIATVHGALADLSGPKEPAPSAKATTAEVRRSIDGDRLVSFIDGKRYAALKRHLRGHDLTPETYRARYGLPHDYPMTAPGYSQRRSEGAIALGLGRKKVGATK